MVAALPLAKITFNDIHVYELVCYCVPVVCVSER